MTNGMRRLGPVVLLLAAASSARADTARSAPLADDPTLIALAVALACADAPEASPGGPSEPPRAGSGPEIELVATIRARALRFDVVPDVNGVFGGAKRRTVWKAERVNLPVRPEAGVVYRDVQVRLTVTSDVDELAALLAEAQRIARGIRIDDAADVPAAAPPTMVARTADPAPASPPSSAHPESPDDAEGKLRLAAGEATSKETSTATTTPSPTADATPVSTVVPSPVAPAEPPAPAAAIVPPPG